MRGPAVLRLRSEFLQTRVLQNRPIVVPYSACPTRFPILRKSKEKTMANQPNRPTNTPVSSAPAPKSTTEQAEQQAKKHVDEAQQKLSEAASQAKRQAAEAGEEIKKQLGDASEAVRQQAAEAANSLRGKGRKLAHEQKHRVASEIDACSAALRNAGERYNEQSETNLGKYATAAAEQLDRAKSYLEERPLEGMLSDVERGIRGHRDLIYGACFVAGLGLARFLKASAEARAEDDMADYSPGRRRPVARPAGVSPGAPAYPRPVEPRHESYTSSSSAMKVAARRAAGQTSSDLGSQTDG